MDPQSESNSFGVNLGYRNISGPIEALKQLYDSMPETKGCDRCAAKYGEDEVDWCCKKNAPSMYYIEFLKIWWHVQEEWSDDDRVDLQLRAIRAYLTSKRPKGCVFYKDGCQIYGERPYACRMYGLMPPETWTQRMESIEDQQGKPYEGRPQCKLVKIKTKGVKSITQEMDDGWFDQIRHLETRLGVRPQQIILHDHAGGSYRSAHDHILIQCFNTEVLMRLTEVRLTRPSEDHISGFIEVLWDMMKENPDAGTGVIIGV